MVAIEKADARMVEIKELKKNAIKNAKISIDGLSIQDDSLYYRDVPLAQASTAEQLKACTQLSIVDKPDISVILMPQASLLDEDNMELVSKMAEELDFQIWMEIVGDGDPLSFVIEDGEVKHSPDGDVVGQEKLF